LCELGLCRFRKPNATDGTDTTWFTAAGGALACEDIDAAFVAGETVGEVAVQLQEERHVAIAAFALGEGAGGWVVW